MIYHLFLDETGDHGLTSIDKNFPLFLLCGCLFSEDSIKKAEDKIGAFKIKYFKTKEVILHSREIRKCEGAFQILFDLNLKAEFYKDLNKIIDEIDYRIIGAGVNKEEHIKKYGKQARDPYSLSLSFIIERVVFCLDSLESKSLLDIKAEVRGKKEDAMLLAHFNSIIDGGTYYVNRERMQEREPSFRFCTKKDNIVGLQIADLTAYPLARHLLNPKEPYQPFNIIKNKIYCDKKGISSGWGLKIFP